jgi:hypothetical protein
VHIEAVETFVFQQDTTVTPVSTLTVAQVDSDKPHVALTFDRATAPDSFSVWRDGRVVDTDLDPADLLVSGTTYQYVDRTAAPHRSHTWQVRCKVNGKLSGGPTATYSFDVAAVWLADLDTGRLVPILFGQGDGITFDMPELTTVLRPVDGDTAQRITQGQYGLEGTVTGRVVEYAGSSASAWAANLLWMKLRPENVLRLTIGAENYPVTIGEVVIEPVNEGDLDSNADDRAVRFAFTTRGGPTS